MKKFLCLLLALVLTVSLCACKGEKPAGTDAPEKGENQEQPGNNESDQNNDQNDNQNKPQEKPELTPEEKKQAIVQDLMLLVNGPDNSDSRESPMRLLLFLDEWFSATGLTDTVADSVFPRSIYNKNEHIMFDFEDHRIQSVQKNELLFMISHKNGGSPEVVGVTSYDDTPNLLTCFGINDALLESLGDPAAGEDNSSDMPPLSASYINVSDDFATCTISENYLQAIFFNLWTGEFPQTEAELNTFLANLKIESLYTVAENKLEISFEITPPGQTTTATITLLVTSDPTNGETVETTYITEGIVDGSFVKAGASVAMRNVKYLREKAYAAEFEVASLALVEAEMQGQKLVMDQENRLRVSIDRSNWDAPKIDVYSKEYLDNTIDGKHFNDAHYSTVKTISGDLGANTISYSETSNDTPVHSVTGKYQLSPSLNINTPNSILQYVDEIYPLYSEGNGQ